MFNTFLQNLNPMNLFRDYLSSAPKSGGGLLTEPIKNNLGLNTPTIIPPVQKTTTQPIVNNQQPIKPITTQSADKPIINTQPQDLAYQPIQSPSVGNINTGFTIPSPISFNINTTDKEGYVPSSVLGSNNTYADVLAKRKQYEDQYAKSLLDASNIYSQGLQAVEQARYAGETSPFAQGQMERVQRNTDLASLAATNRADAYGKLLGINQQNLQNTLAQQPTSLGSQVNPATGDVYVTTRNPLTGQPQVINAGNIGQQKSFVSSSVNQDPFTGQLIFTGVRQDGTLDTQVLNGGQSQNTMQSGQIPFAIQSSINYAGNTPFIDTGNLTAQQIPLAQAYSAQNGLPILSKDDATKLKEASATFSSADALLSTVEQYANKVVTAKNPTDIPAQYLSTKLGSILKTNPDAVLFDSSISAFSSLLTRAAGEKGVLTDKDVARIINGLPTRMDTVESASKKIQALRSIYSSVKDGVFKSYLGSRTAPLQSSGSIIQTKIGPVDNRWFKDNSLFN